MWVSDEDIVHVWADGDGCGLSGGVKGLLGYEDTVGFDDPLDRIEGCDGRSAGMGYGFWELLRVCKVLYIPIIVDVSIEA